MFLSTIKPQESLSSELHANTFVKRLWLSRGCWKLISSCICGLWIDCSVSYWWGVAVGPCVHSFFPFRWVFFACFGLVWGRTLLCSCMFLKLCPEFSHVTSLNVTTFSSNTRGGCLIFTASTDAGTSATCSDVPCCPQCPFNTSTYGLPITSNPWRKHDQWH